MSDLIDAYPASRGFSLTWLLAFTKSFARLVSRANDFVNAKSVAGEKPLLAE